MTIVVVTRQAEGLAGQREALRPRYIGVQRLAATLHIVSSVLCGVGLCSTRQVKQVGCQSLFSARSLVTLVEPGPGTTWSPHPAHRGTGRPHARGQ